MTDVYRPTSRFSVTKVADSLNPERMLNQVTEIGSGMVTDLLTDEAFAQHYELDTSH